MSVLVISGTGTDVGKTVVTAGIAALARAAGRRVAVLKPAQTGVAPGEPGDLAAVTALAGAVTTAELRRFPDPLAPETAARRVGMPPVRPSEVAAATAELARTHDLVLVEGAGGLLVRFDPDGGTLADVAWSLGAPVLVVAHAGLGTLNTAALTAEALRTRGIACAGIVIGSWPAEPDLAARCNLEDLPLVTGAPLVGVVPAGVGGADPTAFAEGARRWLAPSLGGGFDAKEFTEREFVPVRGEIPR
ncbi:dethiobiotin synthase [Actinokineospora sp. PR83]|uniref:dethiobiotin synthase n=1 Tax=Actinokineospora sp. PR83 TaxID=2884908 RepID=UPI0027DF1C35|nr:dethiobiotin synthase [Actinokineospora sp. PR83]MCG8914642.1 dethiobiotin synthase [Actinokineospora sp. PR83]